MHSLKQWLSSKYVIISIITAVIVFFDQLTKTVMKDMIAKGQSIPLIENIFHLTLVHNKGSAFNIIKDGNIFLTIITIIVIVCIIYSINKIKKEEYLLQVCFGLVMGGAFGNLIDRISYGYVIDFLDFRIWPVFNVADSAITISVLGFLWYMYNDGKSTKNNR